MNNIPRPGGQLTNQHPRCPSCGEVLRIETTARQIGVHYQCVQLELNRAASSADTELVKRWRTVLGNYYER